MTIKQTNTKFKLTINEIEKTRLNTVKEWHEELANLLNDHLHYVLHIIDDSYDNIERIAQLRSQQYSLQSDNEHWLFVFVSPYYF